MYENLRRVLLAVFVFEIVLAGIVGYRAGKIFHPRIINNARAEYGFTNPELERRERDIEDRNELVSHLESELLERINETVERHGTTDEEYAERISAIITALRQRLEAMENL